MEREIYLVWQTDEWLSHSSKVLAYIGGLMRIVVRKLPRSVT